MVRLVLRLWISFSVPCFQVNVWHLHLNHLWKVQWTANTWQQHFVVFWKLPIPDKMKYLLWKIICGALPVKTKLSLRNMASPICPRSCHETKEYVLHNALPSGSSGFRFLDGSLDGWVSKSIGRHGY